MEKVHRPVSHSGGEGPSMAEESWMRRAAHELGSFAWSPMAWILLGLFALAEISNWRLGNELTHVCELARGELRSSPTNLTKLEIDNICRHRNAQAAFYMSR